MSQPMKQIKILSQIVSVQTIVNYGISHTVSGEVDCLEKFKPDFR